MKFLYLELNNYIGIYNGMGLYTIQVDLSLGTHRVCVIKGTNGSGKSTIMNALSLFPDGNNAFIPNMNASKIVRVAHAGHIYEAKFYHDVKSNGERDTTKAYIAKSDENGNMIELNTNGNVTRYKDILYTEFKLDPNFFALSKLSMDDRGLGYKKPAERKRFVNSIIESLEVYNDIYKAISKKTSAVKAIMASITTKLGSLGDKPSLEALRDSIDSEIRELQNRRDSIKSRIATLDANIAHIDPDNSIQTTYKATMSALRQMNATLKKEIFTYHSENGLGFFIPEVEGDLLARRLEESQRSLRYFENRLEALRGESGTIISQISSTQSQISGIDLQLASLKTDEYIETEKALNEARAQAKEISDAISVTGIDPNLFTKDEYILALETVHEITNMVDLFRATYDYGMINACIEAYKKTNYTQMPPVMTYDSSIALVESADATMEKYTKEIAQATADLQLTKMLENRPVDCSIDTCYFIADAVKAAATNPKKRLDDLTDAYESFKLDLEVARETIKNCEEYNACLNAIRTIIRSIDKNNAILSRLPNGGIFNSKAEFFEYLVGGNSFVFIDRVYQYINLANYFEQYHIVMKSISQYESILLSLASKKESMLKFEEMKQSLQRTIDGLSEKLRINDNLKKRLLSTIDVCRTRIRFISEMQIPKCDSIIAHIGEVTKHQTRIAEIQGFVSDIQNYESLKMEQVASLKVVEQQIAYKEQEKQSTNFKLMQIQEYEESLAAYNTECQLYEKIKYHSSPTTGIQLVFMELYMGKILELSNQLLSMIFGGQYQLQPFVINEDEFRIPCMGNGYLNDDISSMSSSQLTMISMILSFALLAVSSTEYNVIKLDEIDDPLDEPNRAAFAILLDKIMSIMNTEQCIMISHSSEMIISNVDVIVLRSDGLGSIDESHNIIWDFNRQ